MAAAPAAQAHRRGKARWRWWVGGALLVLIATPIAVLTLIAAGAIALPAQQAAIPTAAPRVVIQATATPRVIRATSTPQPVARATATPVPLPTSTARPAVNSTPLPPASPFYSGNCESFAQGWAEIHSSWRQNLVVFDGQMTSADEWADTACADVILGVPDWSSGEKQWGTSVHSQWWIKNDGDWIYFLVRVPASEMEAHAAAMYYFWPQPYVDHWEHSDGAVLAREDGPQDVYGWDDQAWYDDTDASPPGQNHTYGMSSQDASSTWFEFRKPLNSRDPYDWSWASGDTPHDTGSLVIGAWGHVGEEWLWVETDAALYLAG
jgi:hypothetical protein